MNKQLGIMARTRPFSYLLAWLWLGAFGVMAAEVIPPAPARYFNDYANVISPATAARLNRELEEFEKSTSSQVVVAIFPNMQSDSALEDYTVRVFQAWKVGQKNKNNGAVLFVFVQDRRVRIEVGYGLEGALPDALAKRIIENEITPNFKNGNYDAGLSAGVMAIMQATRGEYKGTGATANTRSGSTRRNTHFPWFWLIAFLIVIPAFRRRSGTVYGSAGRSVGWGLWSFGDWSGGGGGGWGGGGGGDSGFSGGGFSGGGGSSGGGGASGSW